MRRTIRQEYTWQGGAWVQTNKVYYVYDGNVVIQERDINNLPTTTYTRGKDLSGSLDGAGGIGGFLARSDQLPLATGHSFFHADGNGNVTMLINDSQAIVAKYLYDAFGNIISKSGLLADANLYRFSSKESHPNSGLLYYLYRYYDPNLQRWLNRDPFGEYGGLNLYAFIENEPVIAVDAFGLDLWGNLKNTASACKKWCTSGWGAGESKIPTGAANAAAGAGLQIINGAVSVAQTGPGITAIAIIQSACRKCMNCEGDCDEDGSCAKACQACEDAKNKMGPHLKVL